MLLRLIYDDALAQAAYLIGCPASGEAIVFDPQRDVDRYVEAAKREGLKLVAAAETHIHADFLSGCRALAELAVKVYLSAEGGADWQYGWLGKKSGGGSYAHQLLRDGDTFKVGNIQFQALHTPGHTPEHLSFLVTDLGAGVQEPMGVVAGDFVFVGDLGRPDLLETAAGVQGTKEAGARQLYASVRRFVKLPEYLQVWPGHGAGSACGKALGAVPQTTVGYEARFNPAIRLAGGASEGAFTEFILSGQPEPPTYFARMKRQNRDGPPLLGKLPSPRLLSVGDLQKLDYGRVAVLDTRVWGEFKAGHLPGALRDPLDKTFNTIAASYVSEDQDIYVVAARAQLEGAVRALVRVGLDRIVGCIEPETVREYAAAGGKLETTDEVDVAGAKQLLDAGALALDVRRGAEEFDVGHVRGAVNVPHLRLSAELEKLPRGKRILVYCKSGGRSSRAASYLQREGFDVVNLEGGYDAWAAKG
jgi:hydroxyacylglutathione hydrolase